MIQKYSIILKTALTVINSMLDNNKHSSTLTLKAY